MIEHVAYLSVEAGCLGFSLSKDGGPPVYTQSLGGIVLFSEGHRLAPGERLCEVVDLMGHFDGVVRPFGYRGDTLSCRGKFEPGSYSLRTRFAALLQQRQHDPRRDLRVGANDVNFTVRGTSAIPASEAPAVLALRPTHPRHAPSVGQWNETEGRFASSRYVLWLASLNLPEPDSVDVSSLAGVCLAQGRPLTAAAILRVRLERFGYRFNACEAWLDRMERSDRQREFACYLRTWQDNVRVKHHHQKSED